MRVLQSEKTFGFPFLILIVFLLIGMQAFAGEIGTIQVSDLNVRAGPGSGYKVLTRLPRGAKVRIVKRLDGWLEIDHNGGSGFIRNRDRFVRIDVFKEKGENKDAALVSGGLKDLKHKTENIQEKLKASQQELADVKRKEKDVLRAFNAVEEALNTARNKVREARQDLKALQENISKIEKQADELEKRIGANEAYAARRLVALYKLSGVGRIELLASADSFFDFISRKNALRQVLKQDESLLRKLHDDRTALDSILSELNTKKAENRALELSYEQQAAALKKEKSKRAVLLEKIRSEKALAEAALLDLKEAARNLDVTLRNLRPETPAARPPAEASAGKSFDAYKGLLNWPVRGKILSFYGSFRDEKYNVVNFNSGIMIKAERGEPIRAVSDGYTIFSSWFKGYGNMMIIDHGNHYYTVYAHLEEVFKVKGDRVDKGEVVATVGDSGSLTGPALHFEVRHHGKPMDPLEWIRKG